MRDGHRFRVCVHCDLDLIMRVRDMTLVQRHDTHLGHVQQRCIILSTCRRYHPTRILSISYLDLGDVTLTQVHNKPLEYGQQWCEILSRSNMVVGRYGSDMDFGYVCIVALTVAI